MDRKSLFWIPSLLGAAFLIIGVVLQTLMPTLPKWTLAAGVVAALAMWALAWVLSSGAKAADKSGGGRGGHAIAYGQDSEASGGRGGDKGTGSGGRGGSAIASGKGSRAKGGDGGNG